MKIIRTIIFCAGLMVYTSLAAQASIKNITNDTDFSTDKSRLLSSSDISQLSPQGFSLSLPEQTPITDYPQVASVQFITGEGALTFSPPSFSDPSVEICKDKGYTLTKCDKSGQIAGNRCPYNSAYFEECCDSAYKYSKSECSAPLTISSDSCGGKYKCYCDTSKYKYTSCTAPQVLGGSSCSQGGTTRYSDCVCPSNYNQTCTAQNQQGSGTGCTYGGTTKYTACKCKSGYTMTCGDKGPVTPSDYCLLNGIKYYNNCKTCDNKCTLASCPVGASCTYEDCSQKYCAVGCATNYTDWCTKPETDCAKLGYTKSASQCPDGYLTCPYNSAAVFCESEVCPSGYSRKDTITWRTCNLLTEEEVESEEVPGCFKCQEKETCKIGSVLGSDKKCYNSGGMPSTVTPVAIVFDTTNKLAVALTDAMKNGSAGSEMMYWSSGYCDTPNLENCTDSGTINTLCGVDGRANTDAILASTCGGTTYVANAVNAYQTSNCSADFCQKGKWFLPSIRDLHTIYSFKTEINNLLTLLVSMGASNLQEGYYWSSTEYGGNVAWGFHMERGAEHYYPKSTNSYVRPVLYYGEEKACTYSTECPGYDFASCSTGYLSQPCTACGTTKYKCIKACDGTGCSGYTLTERQACDTCTYGARQCTDSCGTMKFKCCSSSEAYLCFKCTIDDDIMAQ